MPKTLPKSRRQTRAQACRQSPRQGRPCLSGRRFRLYFPRLSRAAAAEPQIRRAAGQCRARLLQHAVEAVARHAAGQPADPSRHHLRQVGDHLPQQALSRLQGAPAAGARRPDPAIRADPRGGARLRPALPRAGRLRGRRSDRDLCARGRRARRHRDHRLLRQGPDAARDRQGHDVRHHEGPPHRHRRGDREIRRAAGKGGRGAGAGRRFHRQRAGRARHRHQDRGPADRRIWRPRNAAAARRRDQAAEAARGADRERREGADLAATGAARRQGRARRAARRTRGARARCAQADRVPEGDGILHADPPRRRIFADRSGRRGGGRGNKSGAQRASARRRQAAGRRRHRRSVRPTLRAAAQEAAGADKQDKAASLKGTPSRSPRRAPKPRERLPVDRSKYQTIRSLDRAQGLDRARPRRRPFRDRRQDRLDRSDAGRYLRHRAGAGAERRLLRPARPQAVRRRRRPVRRRARAGPDQGRRRARRAEAAAGIGRHPEDRLQHQIQRRDARAARHHAAQPSTTRS